MLLAILIIRVLLAPAFMGREMLRLRYYGELSGQEDISFIEGCYIPTGSINLLTLTKRMIIYT